MKARYLIAGILIVGGFALFLTRPTPNPKEAASQAVVQEPKINATEINSPVALPKLQPPPGKVNTTNDPLASAYEMAFFINQAYEVVPPEQYSVRNHYLKGLQVACFLNDYVMAAKTNSSLALSKSAITDAFTKVSHDTSIITARLETYAERPGTLSDHYQSTSENPQVKDQIKAIRAALTENSVAIDTESDLLMDCIRHAYSISFINEMYGANPRRIEEATPYPPALSSLVNASDTVFRHRFETRFGLSSATVSNLVNRLKGVRLYDVSPSDMQIPAHIR